MGGREGEADREYQFFELSGGQIYILVSSILMDSKERMDER